MTGTVREEQGGGREPRERAPISAGVVRLLAVLGPAALLLEEGRRLAQEPQYLAPAAIGAAATALAVALALALLAPRTAGRLTSRPELLAPLGVLLFGNWVLTRAAANPETVAMLGGERSYAIGSHVVTVSLLHAAIFALYLGYAVTATLLVLDLARGAPPDLGRALARTPRLVLRAALLHAVGFAVMLGIWRVAMRSRGLSLDAVESAFALALAGLAWNLVSAPLLVLGLAAPGGIASALRRTLLFGLRCFPLWSALLVAQHLILGWVRIELGGAVEDGFERSFGTEVVWLGGYVYRPRLHEAVTEAFGGPDLAPFGLAAAFFLGVLALVVKLRVAETLVARGPLARTERAAGG